MNQLEKAVERALFAYNAYRNACAWGSDEEVLTDLIADLMHLADALRDEGEISKTVEEILDSAKMYYDNENRSTDGNT